MAFLIFSRASAALGFASFLAWGFVLLSAVVAILGALGVEIDLSFAVDTTAHGPAVEVAGRVDVTIANLSILKTGEARAVRFSTLAALCRVLQCQPGDLLVYAAEGDDPT